MFHHLASKAFVASSKRLTPSYSASSTKLLGLTSLLISVRYSVSDKVYDYLYRTMASPTVLPRENHTASLIFLHGLGDTGHGWCAGFEEISSPHIKYIFPNAPISKVTLNFGVKMPSWFDIKSLDASGEEDLEGLKNSSDSLLKLVEEEEKNGIPPERIIIGGFSQGGSVALHAALTSEKKFAGVILLSTWLTGRSMFPQAIKGDKSSFKVLQCHGDSDPVLNYQLGLMTKTAIQPIFKDYKFLTYKGMGHSSSPQEMRDVQEFVTKCLP